MLDKKDIVTKP